MKRLLLVLGLLCACSKAREPEAGSQTHFLSDCNGSCAAPYSCLCGVCTLACSRANECSDAPGDAACVAPGNSAGSCSAAKLCDVECERNADCSAVGAQFSCEAGRCRETATGNGGTGGSAGASAGGRGGQGGSGGSAQGGSTQAGTGGLPALCQLPPVTGPCDALINRFYYEPASSRCKPLDYGGCEGNANNFLTMAECEAACGGGSSGSRCDSSADCVLIPTGCCAACTPTKTDVEAVLRSAEEAETELNCPGGPPACGPCAPAAYDPEHAIVRAACVAGQCAVLDLREEPETACSSNDDCNLAEQGCCGSCGGDPISWISVSSGTTDPYPLTCDPIPPCTPCTLPDEPEPFCADDGHCAVREIARVDGVPSTTCISPAQNLEGAYEAGAVGCDCGSAASGASLCIRDSTGRDVALTCDTHWTVIEDGPCGV